MQERREFIDYVIELLGPFGTVQARRMFGGHGVYLDGLCFAIVADEALWLKTDEINRAEFEAAGCEPFAYRKGGRLARMSYYRVPVDAMDSAQEMLPWARSAYAAALRAHAKQVADDERRAQAPAAKRGTRRTAAAARGAAKKKGASRGTAASPRGTRKAAAKRPSRHRPRRG